MIDVSPYLFGGLAAMFAETITFPVDTAKTRLQLQGQDCDKWKLQRYRGMVHCLVSLVREEGVASLYQGISPALIRQAVYGTIKFGLYYSAKETLSSVTETKESPVVNLTCAIFAGSVSSAIATPTDVIKVRMQAKATRRCGGFVKVARDIYSLEGLAGLWRGVLPTAQRAALVAGVQLPVYDLTKEKLCASNNPHLKESVVCHLISSLTAGVSAAVASNPVDVVRTRIMVQRRYLKTHHHLPVAVTLYRSALHCGIHTVSTEGLTALYKGFIPAFARMGPWNVIFFIVYEKLKALKI